ncbi:hypothetical protein AAFF_G00259660 [Aldrovandia affinis]|uniref:Interleukin family protein n=1 Tax=Aldrovandia affinis TaxID=143900 RepID=A0AAD7W301_9TELE|nr:hypothetical protein AAFF_G00259660 [Aldrovandia affinis]
MAMSLYSTALWSALLFPLLPGGVDGVPLLPGGVDSTRRCCAFEENFHLRLKELRTSFVKLKGYYEDRDEIETALLDASVLQEIGSPSGCRAINDVLRFYLDTVLPQAEERSEQLKGPIASITNIFHELKRELLHCVSVEGRASLPSGDVLNVNERTSQ